MEKEELLETNEVYDKMKENWEFYQAAYKGTKALIDWGALRQYEGDIENFKARKRNAFGFNYSKRIVKILSDFLREIPFDEELGVLEKSEFWKKFTKDCDLYGTNWDSFWNFKRRWVSVYGYSGILVDKAQGQFGTYKEELENDVYPYLAFYGPLNILDWKFERDPNTNRPILTYLKLYEDNKTVRIWETGSWEVWKLPEKNDETPEMIAYGKNPFLNEENRRGEIPFVWYGNGQDTENIIESISDIADISLIDASMLRDASHSDEIIVNAAFPMLALPKEEITEGGENTPVEVGPTRIVEFEPGRPGDKPFWLESKVLDSIQAILKVWERKSEEMYDLANLGAVKAASKSRSARSGETMKESFRFLNSSLAEKVDNEIEARLLCIKYWMKWQNMEEQFEEVSITHEKKFNAEKLLTTMKDALEAKEAVESKTFKSEIQKLIARRTLPNLKGDVAKRVDDEVEREEGS